MYERRSRLPSYQQGELLKMFVGGATARAAAEVLGVHRNTAVGATQRCFQELFPTNLNSDQESKLIRAK
jgi:transposase-like protein